MITLQYLLGYVTKIFAGENVTFYRNKLGIKNSQNIQNV